MRTSEILKIDLYAEKTLKALNQKLLPMKTCKEYLILQSKQKSAKEHKGEPMDLFYQIILQVSSRRRNKDIIQLLTKKSKS